jgi:hypothetical protein
MPEAKGGLRNPQKSRDFSIPSVVSHFFSEACDCLRHALRVIPCEYTTYFPRSFPSVNDIAFTRCQRGFRAIALPCHRSPATKPPPSSPPGPSLCRNPAKPSAWSSSPGRLPGRGPLGTGRGDFHHPALPWLGLAAAQTPDRHHDPRAGERVVPEHLLEPLPRQSRPLAATVQPLVPRPAGVTQQAGQTLEVPIDPEVVVMAL